MPNIGKHVCIESMHQVGVAVEKWEEALSAHQDWYLLGTYSTPSTRLFSSHSSSHVVTIPGDRQTAKDLFFFFFFTNKVRLGKGQFWKEEQIRFVLLTWIVHNKIAPPPQEERVTSWMGWTHLVLSSPRNLKSVSQLDALKPLCLEAIQYLRSLLTSVKICPWGIPTLMV